MLERIWSAVFGDLGTTQLGFIFAALSFCWNQISTVLKRRADSRKEMSNDILQQAVIITENSKEAQEANVKIDMENDVSPETGMAILEKAVDAAFDLAKSRKINLAKELGGREGVKAATQTTFKQIKNILRRDK